MQRCDALCAFLKNDGMHDQAGKHARLGEPAHEHIHALDKAVHFPAYFLLVFSMQYLVT